jgi:hypothetical protein
MINFFQSQISKENYDRELAKDSAVLLYALALLPFFCCSGIIIINTDNQEGR